MNSFLSFSLVFMSLFQGLTGHKTRQNNARHLKFSSMIQQQQHVMNSVESTSQTIRLPTAIANYTSYMHIFTEVAGDPSLNWNASIVEYFTMFPNGDSYARDDNFYISFGTGVAAEDSVEIGYCYGAAELQDTWTITYPTNSSLQSCTYFNVANYEQGCVSYFANMPNSIYNGTCISPYSDQVGDSYVLNYPGVVYLQYCMVQNSTTVPLFYKSILDGQTMLVIFALFSGEAAPSKVFDIPSVCDAKTPTAVPVLTPTATPSISFSPSNTEAPTSTPSVASTNDTDVSTNGHSGSAMSSGEIAGTAIGGTVVFAMIVSVGVIFMFYPAWWSKLFCLKAKPNTEMTAQCEI